MPGRNSIEVGGQPRLALVFAVGAALPCTHLGGLGVVHAQLRIATWNVSHFDGSAGPGGAGRKEAFQTAIYASFQARQMAPDVLITQEMLGQAGIDAFRDLLNTAPGSPGDWAVSPFVPSPDNNAQALFYRTSRVTLLDLTVIAEGGPAPLHPRPVQRFDIRPAGYTGSVVIACYSTHMKAGSSALDRERRLVEAWVLRSDAESLPGEWNFLLAGDLNMQSSYEQAYLWLVGAQLNDDGRFFDPISKPGAWHNNVDFRFVHTQAPAASPGMDDRFDLILLSAGLLDGSGFSYLGDPSVPCSTTTWNDPNHSYRVWGNDGTSFRQTLTIQGNSMVGPVIAQALYDAAVTDPPGGHLPVYLDLRVPPKVDSAEVINFGHVEVGATGSAAERMLRVRNSGDVQLWTVGGIGALEYSLEASGGFGAPAGMFATAAGAPGGEHIITIDTSEPGLREGLVRIVSNAPEEPERVVVLVGNIVLAHCYANCDGSTTEPILTVDDFNCFINAFAEAQGLPPAQQIEHYANCDGSTTEPILTVDDFTCFINAFAEGCL